MNDIYYLFIAALLIVAIFLGEDYVLTLIYVFVGVLILGKLWGGISLKKLSVRREFTRRAFLGEKVQVRFQLKNKGWAPIAWLQVRESLPIELSPKGAFQRVFTLGPKSNLECEYSLDCRKRGYYSLGPLDITSGDVLGVGGIQRHREPPEYITVYPKIIHFTSVFLPSYSPMGTLRQSLPVFADPSRVMGKRDYIVGDSMRSVDWKATAAIGRMQVKLLQPSVALETEIVLNMNAVDFDLRSRFDISELSIVIAASLANWIVNMRQAVGLATNGRDMLSGGVAPPAVLPKQGRGHLLRILETLARIQVYETIPFVEFFRREIYRLSWGATVVLITTNIDDSLFDAVFQARRRGLSVFLIQCGATINFPAIRRKAKAFGFPIIQVFSERDLDFWRN